MSYYFPVYFKRIDSVDSIPSFFRNLKKKVLDSKKEWGNYFKDCFWNIPNIDEFKLVGSDFQRLKILNDIEDAFSHKYFINEELGVFGLIGCPPFCEEMFDGQLEFQNSCDQDYEFDTWNKIPGLKHIVNKYVNMPASKLIKKLKYLDSEELEDIETLDYYRRTACYEEIEKIFMPYTGWDNYSDKDTTLYISFFRQCDMESYSVLFDMLRAGLIAHKKEIEDWKTTKK